MVEAAAVVVAIARRAGREQMATRMVRQRQEAEAQDRLVRRQVLAVDALVPPAAEACLEVSMLEGWVGAEVEQSTSLPELGSSLQRTLCLMPAVEVARAVAHPSQGSRVAVVAAAAVPAG